MPVLRSARVAATNLFKASVFSARLSILHGRVGGKKTLNFGPFESTIRQIILYVVVL